MILNSYMFLEIYFFFLKKEREDKIQFDLVLKFIAPLDISFLKLVDFYFSNTFFTYA